MDNISEMLSYRPRLKRTKPVVVEHYTDYTKTEYNFSNCYNSLVDNKPSLTLMSMNNDIKYIENVVDNIKMNISLKYGSDFDDKLDDLIKENDNISGDSSFEVYKIVKEDFEHIKALTKVYKECMFGDEDPKTLESLIIQQIEEFENGEYEDKDNINYTLIAYDSLLSSVLINYSSSISNLAKSFYDCVYNDNDSQILDYSENMDRIFKEKYDRLNKKNIANRNQCNMENSKKTDYILSNIFEQRDLMEDAQIAYVDIDKTKFSKYIDILMEAREDEINIGFDMITDLIKNTLLTIIVRDDYVNTLSEKLIISDYYKFNKRM